MKIQFDKAGAVPTQPDFAMLRAGLIAAQAASPTALAEGAPPARDPANRLIDSLAWPLDEAPETLKGASFHPATARRGAAEE